MTNGVSRDPKSRPTSSIRPRTSSDVAALPEIYEIEGRDGMERRDVHLHLHHGKDGLDGRSGISVVCLCAFVGC